MGILEDPADGITEQPGPSRRTRQRWASTAPRVKPIATPPPSVQPAALTAELIEAAGGVTAAAAKLGRSPRTVQRWVQTRPSPVSEYGAVYHDLRNRLLSGEWKVGDKLPSIAGLMTHYDVRSLNTIRSAQAVLVNEGLIQTQKGLGAFVVALPEPTLPAPTAESILEKVRAAQHMLSEIESDLTGLHGT